MINNQNNTIIFKHTSAKGRAPTKDDIVVGEIAINTHSGTVYSIDEQGAVFIFGERIPLVYNASTIDTQDGTVSFHSMNQTMTLRGSEGCRTEANAKTNTIDVIADTVDAVKLNGQLPSFYATATHLHDDRYAPQETKKVEALTGGSWYRLATADSVAGTTRAAATFNVSTPNHYVRFNAIGQGLTTSGVNILGGYNTGEAELTEIRIVSIPHNKIALDMYLGGTLDSSFVVTLQNDITNHNGWTLLDPVAVSVDLGAGFFEYALADVSRPYGFDTSAEIREQGQRVFSPNNKPKWTDITNIPETLPPSSHTHDDLYYTETEIDKKFDAILSGALDELNSFKELSNALLDNTDAISAINTTLDKKASKAGDTFTGDVKFDKGNGILLGQSLRFNSANTGLGWGVTQQADNNLYYQLRTSEGVWANKAHFDSTGQLFVVGNNKVWHQGNDGAKSGLDADLLDGEQGSYYRNAGNINAGTLAIARLTGTYNIGISGTAKTATDANNAVNLNDEAASYYLNAANFNDGILPSARLSGSYDIAVTGNAASASKLKTTRNIALSGDATGNVDFDGSKNVTLSVTVTNDSHTHDGRYYTETESDLRYSAVAKSGDTHSLICKDTRSVISPPSDYNSGMYNEFKFGHSVGLTSNAFAFALTHAPWSNDSGTGNSQLLFQAGALYLRYGTRASGWNDPQRIYTTAFKPTASDMGAIPAVVGKEDASEAWFNVPFLADNADKTGHSILKQATSKIRFQPKNGQLQVAHFKCDSWIRTDTGWHNDKWKGGMHMTDATWIKTCHGKKLKIGNTSDDAIYTTGGFTADLSLTVFKWKFAGSGVVGNTDLHLGDNIKFCASGMSVSNNLVFHDGNRPTVDQVTGTVDFGTF